MTKAPSDQAKPGREARLQRALRENLMRRKEQLRARRVTADSRAQDHCGDLSQDPMGSQDGVGGVEDEGGHLAPAAAPGEFEER